MLDYQSPHFNNRPPEAVVDCIVLHSTANSSLAETVRWFLNPESKVSAHFVVDKDGAIVKMVPITERAWHAGVSVLDGVVGVNDYSIGIEMVNWNDGEDPYPEAQYLAVAEIIQECRKHCHIPDNRIVSHAEIALLPGRKTDPEGFDFDKIKRLARKPSAP
jgi:N-acetylmuramoyl-L-alanine amidase